MSDDPLQVYLSLANDLFDRQISEGEMDSAASKLPTLQRALLDTLAERAESFALTEPRRGWAIAKVAESAAQFQKNPFIQSLAAWYLGRASNHWGQPRRADAAISRARRGFEALTDMGWVAACDWQLNALPWTRPDFVQSAAKLKEALEILENTGFEAFALQCRLTLSYAQLLIGNYEEAKENIAISEEAFASMGDGLNVARCWYNTANLLRRQGDMNAALEILDKALACFESENAVVDSAKVYYQLALCHLIMVDDLALANEQFEKAIEIFKTRGMDLWQAMCTTNLGYVYLLKGSLATAAAHFRQARKSFIHHKANGMLADNLNDSGKLNVMLGRLEASVKQFQEAEKLHSRLGLKLSAAIDAANLGEAYGHLGRYQDALHFLEHAAEQLNSLGNYVRLGSCEIFTALIWARLGQPAAALRHLDKAAAYHEKSNPKGSFSSVQFHRAAILFSQKEYKQAVECLKDSLHAAEVYGMRPQAALAQRLLGEAMLSMDRSEEARGHLTQAHTAFAEMGMSMEQAAALAAIGFYYLKTAELDRAGDAFQEALSLSGNDFPEIAWKAYAGLANIAEIVNNAQAEIQFYRKAMTALAKIRRNFWQPALAGSYLQGPSVFFDSAIVRSTEMGTPQDTLQFIEQNKATTLLLQLSASRPVSRNEESQELADLRSEIGWLKDQLRVSFDSNNRLKSALQLRQMRTQLTQKARLFDEMCARSERRSMFESADPFSSGEFDLAAFRRSAANALGKSWACLNYYLTDRQLITAVVTPDDCRIFASPLTERIIMALRASAGTNQNVLPQDADLRALGDLLIPEALSNVLTPETVLLLAPHERLHGIPWAAIQPGFLDQPLVCNCIPAVIPSMQSLVLLWERAASNQPMKPESGLLIGMSNFRGLERDLPFVRAEVAVLRSNVGPNGKLLAEHDATWQNLARLAKAQETTDQRAGLSRFSWMHIASHFFVDAETGRLCGIALADGDMWLDKFRDLAPLPNLVTFSACNSIYSYVYEGDEHVGIPTTCLIAGANSIVGSTWPILDESAARFATLFYRNYFESPQPARAVAYTQRELIEQKKAIYNWASFICIGIPY